ncbi:gfo/Idh/MocA family oxidoreductase [Porphyrobacter algicida]|uniref:Gfo/Idh/MocA family oxidoreductase n=2 Tax=Qipengyuania algicida TaxID=1836209 RepID=A0A845ALS4_9SPHN|nr:gfo/Idh/MocA family oxidoreductase [Qipengyuania algicida]
MNGRPLAIVGRKIRIAVIGCGRISKNHFGAIEAYPEDFEIVAVCDVMQDLAQEAADKYGCIAFTDLELMLEQCKPDVVSLCTPSGLHPAHTIAVARHGAHVVTEKPMATRWRDGLNMVGACDRAGVYLFVVKQNRRNATLQLLKRAIDDGRFGRIHLVHVNVLWARDQAYYDQADWRGTWEFDGGAFMNQASHYVDLFEWLFGPVDKVQAMMSTTRKIESEDTGVLNVHWRSGALGSMAVTMLTYPKNLEGSITVVGETGTVRVGGLAVNDVQHWAFADERDYDEQVQNASYATTSVYGFGHPLYYQNVVDTLRGKDLPHTDGREGLKSLELLVAAYRSARDGVTVSLPLER